MSKFIPTILPEDLSPGSITDCQKCQLAKQRTRVIWGEGNLSAPVFVILDNPGAREDKFGQPFLCGTRETLQKSAYAVGILPEQLYVSYILKCRPLRAYDKPKARKACISYLWRQLQATQPKVILVLGNVAAQAYFEDEAAEVKNLRGVIHQVKQQSIVVSYHPLAVRRRPNLNKYFLEDWQLAASLLAT